MDGNHRISLCFLFGCKQIEVYRLPIDWHPISLTEYRRLLDIDEKDWQRIKNRYDELYDEFYRDT